MAAQVRVRFSPAPTGMLHVGSARTALFNWLYARHTGGTFILRIEDTDVARSRTEWVDQIQMTLRWLGLDWDDGPHLQSHRFDTYLAAAERLLVEGFAYECYCTEEEIKERNEEARRDGRAPGYDGRCRDLTVEQRLELVGEGRPRAIRFRTPDEGRSTFTDLIRGDVSVEWSTISDFVIVRSNSTPVFFLANAVDDIDMEITHVLRGEDLIDSTHRVLALRRALGSETPPAYAHLPLILGPGGAKLSKRHGAVALEEFRDEGYLPSAVLNYLALQGWGPEDGNEVMETDSIVAQFDLDGVSHSAAMFDHQKLDWMNGEHIRALPLADLVGEVLPFARDRYGGRLDVQVFEDAVALAQPRAKTLVHIAQQVQFLFIPEDEFRIDEAAWEKISKIDRLADFLDAAIQHLAVCAWDPESIDLRPLIEGLGLPVRKTMKAVFAVTQGSDVGLPAFEAIYLLTRETTLARLRAARARL
ncbi:MAG: glutamyl-tRNA synthetase [Actinomycetia bacterium]|jgi:glutamyl-tRNA synthetase|nr:glutamyl-tRNA synthetase [Actinomycetes bacterium]